MEGHQNYCLPDNKLSADLHMYVFPNCSYSGGFCFTHLGLIIVLISYMSRITFLY